MIYILLTALSSTSIFVIFRFAKNYSINISSLITMNYLVASLFGFAFLMKFKLNLISVHKPWIFIGILLGTLFIIMFYLIGLSSQKAGITLTTLANKISLVIPVFFSIYWFHEKISLIKYVGLVLAIVSISLTLYKSDLGKTKFSFLFLPIIIFFGSGFTDSVVKYAQAVSISSNESAMFSAFVFFVAFLFATIFTLVKNKTVLIHFYSPTFFFGILLGLVNFGSLYFIINALNKSKLDSSLVFALINISIVCLSAIIGILYFKEKLNKLNITGIILAILSLFLLV
ncbi:MAG: DMT family transporter [Draconibacterium sp.]